MRLAKAEDIGNLVDVYQDAVIHANDAGKIDWPNPVPKLFVADLVSTNELYCFEDEGINAAIKLSHQRDERIWGNDPTPALYLAKLATGNRVRGQNYFRESMLPVIMSFAGPEAALRLDCLADNIRLHKFYENLGYTSRGDISFFSEKQKQTLIVTRFERPATF